jgi:curli biogenesis system outer membrane secretion channel CsgG
VRERGKELTGTSTPHEMTVSPLSLSLSLSHTHTHTHANTHTHTHTHVNEASEPKSCPSSSSYEADAERCESRKRYPNCYALRAVSKAASKMLRYIAALLPAYSARFNAHLPQARARSPTSQ